MDDYKLKYLKYKQKYLILKQKGGLFIGNYHNKDKVLAMAAHKNRKNRKFYIFCFNI